MDLSHIGASHCVPPVGYRSPRTGFINSALIAQALKMSGNSRYNMTLWNGIGSPQRLIMAHTSQFVKVYYVVYKIHISLIWIMRTRVWVTMAINFHIITTKRCLFCIRKNFLGLPQNTKVQNSDSPGKYSASKYLLGYTVITPLSWAWS